MIIPDLFLHNSLSCTEQNEVDLLFDLNDYFIQNKRQTKKSKRNNKLKLNTERSFFMANK